MRNVTLFCLPFAGGNKNSYLGYINKAPRNVKIVPLEPPGRNTRYKERLASDIDELVLDYFKQILDNLTGPYMIYGHSLGALTGYLLAKKIVSSNLPHPEHLILTGCGAPSTLKVTLRSSLNKKDFIKQVSELGGLPDELLQNEQFLDFIEPILRADFKIIENYSYTPLLSPLSIPITIVTGDQEGITDEQVVAWQIETEHKLKSQKFPGKHFFILDQEKEILELITHLI